VIKWHNNRLYDDGRLKQETMKKNYKKQKPSPEKSAAEMNGKEQKQKYHEVWVPATWFKGNSEYIYIDEITIHYSFN
jgi:hypothetical protein